ncbi:MBOAT family O-acyltransferase [[Clostridium] polysaccharolyticum]|uniref:Alginate O-acetyltransferase complex protein AlgI n=1 Tax=[Clostridium] polysaccharolyticum TaxID=29364 RepID=A0A1I0BMC7_9FIRM|nr:MBOAT family protein [[Clostridium] polysaccharolyticum]SET08113.1 alginate O-acetyltransferase complex protein AlgI [[Clostridium] polysaccharolyticum]
MVFSSTIFLCGFLPLVVFLYYGIPAKFRNGFLLLASLFFYGWGEPVYLSIMAFSTVFDYVNGRLIEHYKEKQRRGAAKGILVLSIVGNIGILCFFKYTDFLIASINRFTGGDVSLLNLALPIGISFYTFQTMSYTIDVYRGNVKAQHNIISFGMYVTLFPQLIAGPIVRYTQISKEVEKRGTSFDICAQGIQRFIIGLAKKVLLANQIGVLWAQIQTVQENEMSVALAWLGAASYTLQIYFDFSGYSDMAIGLGKIFGFHFPENFSYPYESQSITEFWRRWHMTLGTWFREYLYIPLGGNRKGRVRHIINLFVVWFLTGLWHGAGWNFILWGLYYFIFLVAEKLFLLKFLDKTHPIVRHVYTMFVVISGWVIFSNEKMQEIFKFWKGMFGAGVPLINDLAIYELLSYGILLAVLIIGTTSIPKRLGEKLRNQLGDWVIAVYTVVLLLLCMAFLISGTYNPFLYFRF